MSKALPVIVVETQERKLAKAMKKLGTVEVIVQRLTPVPAGDVMFMAGKCLWGVEMKSCDDLVSSFSVRTKGKPSRLDSQMKRMLEYYDRVVLMIRWGGGMWVEGDGTIVTGRPRRVYWDALWNRISYWQVKGVMLEVVSDISHAARRIVGMQRYWDEKGEA